MDAPLTCEAEKVLAGKYRLERPAGFGGMAELWVATNQATGAEVCIKVLVIGGDDPEVHEEAIERFRREALAAANLNHRAIVRVFDLLELDANGDAAGGKSPHAYAMVMELLHGETLGDHLMKKGKLEVEEALDLFLPIMSALAHAHRASVIHRDIKPDNIFLATDPDGHVSPKVLDFGVSKLASADAITVDGVVLGTPSYMSPEQAKGARQLDARSDVFSAATLFHLMLTGANPFDDATFANVVDAIVRREVTAIPDLSPAIWDVLERAFKKDPGERWNDATEMGIALRKAAGRKATESNPLMPIPLAPISTRSAALEPPAPESSDISVPPTGSVPSEALENGKRRRMIVVGVMGGALLILLVGLAVGGRKTSPIPATKTAAAAPIPVPAPAPEPEPAPAPTPSALASVIPVVAPPPAASGPKPIRRGHPAQPSGRKPGHEPDKARQPGF